MYVSQDFNSTVQLFAFLNAFDFNSNTLRVLYFSCARLTVQDWCWYVKAVSDNNKYHVQESRELSIYRVSFLSPDM